MITKNKNLYLQNDCVKNFKPHKTHTQAPNPINGFRGLRFSVVNHFPIGEFSPSTSTTPPNNQIHPIFCNLFRYEITKHNKDKCLNIFCSRCNELYKSQKIKKCCVKVVGNCNKFKLQNLGCIKNPRMFLNSRGYVSFLTKNFYILPKF